MLMRSFRSVGLLIAKALHNLPRLSRWGGKQRVQIPAPRQPTVPLAALRAALKIGYIPTIRSGKHSRVGPVRPAGSKLARKAAEGKLAGVA